MNRRTLVEFRKKGYYTAWGYKKELHVALINSAGLDENLLVTGRDTFLSAVIEKYIIKRNFLWNSKRNIRRNLTESQFRLLKGLIECGSKSWHLFEKALEENWSEEKLISKIFFRVV